MGLSSAEAELYGSGSGAMERLGAVQLLQEWQYKAVPLLQKDSQGALAVCKRRGLWSNETCQVEDDHCARRLKTERLRVHKVDSRQPGRPHNQSRGN